MAVREELTALLARSLHAPSPFYRRRLMDAGITDAASAANAFARLPLTCREDIRRDQLDHLPHGTRRFADAAPPVRAGTTGTGETLLVLTWSAADLALERAAGVRLLGRLGITRDMCVANTLPGALATPGSLLLGDVIEDLGALDVPLGLIENEAAARQAWELVDRVQPAVMILDDASGTRLFAKAPSAPRAWWRGIVWLHSAAAARPPVPEVAGFAGWQRAWLAVPEATCFVAYTCAASRYHVDDGVLAEIVDGGLVLTPFGRDTPLLRYASGVAARAVAACSCGAGGTVLELTP